MCPKCFINCTVLNKHVILDNIVALILIAMLLKEITANSQYRKTSLIKNHWSEQETATALTNTT